MAADGNERGEEEGWEIYLRQIYFDPRHPGSFKGAHKLFEVVKEEGKHAISLRDIKRWLQNQESFSLGKPVRRAFRRLKVIVQGMGDQYEADLADMQKFKNDNNGVRFLLVVIDVFSRFIWVETLRSKGQEDVISAFRKIFERTSIPRRLRTDRGGEFVGSKVSDYLDGLNIEHWSAHNDEMKANFAERVIRTLKGSIWGYMRKFSTDTYIDKLPDLVHSYNNTKHRSINMKPSEVTRGDVERQLWWELYKPKDAYVKGKRSRVYHHLRKEIMCAYLTKPNDSNVDIAKSGRGKSLKSAKCLYDSEFLNSV